MAFARARAARTLQSSFRRSIPRVSAPGRTQLVQRRWASGGDHGHAEPSSDIPWMIGAVAVTIPSMWYLWPDQSHADAGHHGSHDEEHGEEGGEGEEEKSEEGGEEEPKEEEPKDEESGPVEDAKPDTEKEQKKEEKEDEEKVEGGEEKKEDKEEGGESGGQKKTGELKKDDESKPTKTEANTDEGAEVKKEQKDRTIRKSLPSSGQPLTKSPDETGGEGEAKGSGGSMESKQGGVSNTQAKHSMNIADSPDKSKKPEGVPDTAKNSGTVAVKRHD